MPTPPQERSAPPASPETAARGSYPAPAAVLPPASQTAHPDVHTPPAWFPALLSATHPPTSPLLPVCAQPGCSQRIQSTALSLAGCGSQSVFPPQCPAAPHTAPVKIG